MYIKMFLNWGIVDVQYYVRFRCTTYIYFKKSYMFWYNVISHNPSYYLKMYISEITNFLVNCIIMNFHQIFNCGIFKSFVIYRQFCVYSDAFANMFL